MTNIKSEIEEILECDIAGCITCKIALPNCFTDCNGTKAQKIIDLVLSKLPERESKSFVTQSTFMNGHTAGWNDCVDEMKSKLS